MAGTGCEGEREKELKNPVLISRIRSETAGFYRDGGFAFSDVLDLRGELVNTELFCLLIQCPTGESVTQPATAESASKPRLFCS